jgi:hypothetical protein
MAVYVDDMQLPGAALAEVLNRKAPDLFSLACSQNFTDAQTGRQFPIWYPYSAVCHDCP